MAELDKIGPVCQSCSMPLENEKDYGTKAGGGKATKYCHFCYKDGRFTEPDITMEEMIEKVVSVMMLMKVMEEAQVREIAKTIIPKLERWSKRKKGR